MLVNFIEIGFNRVIEDGFFDVLFEFMYVLILVFLGVNECKIFIFENLLLFIEIFFINFVLWYKLKIEVLKE